MSFSPNIIKLILSTLNINYQNNLKLSLRNLHLLDLNMLCYKQNIEKIAFTGCTNILAGHSKYVKCITQLKNGNIATGSSDIAIRIWDINRNFKCINILGGHKEEITCIIVLQ